MSRAQSAAFAPLSDALGGISPNGVGHRVAEQIERIQLPHDTLCVPFDCKQQWLPLARMAIANDDVAVVEHFERRRRCVHVQDGRRGDDLVGATRLPNCLSPFELPQTLFCCPVVASVD